MQLILSSLDFQSLPLALPECSLPFFFFLDPIVFASVELSCLSAFGCCNGYTVEKFFQLLSLLVKMTGLLSLGYNLECTQSGVCLLLASLVSQPYFSYFSVGGGLLPLEIKKNTAGLQDYFLACSGSE